MIDQTRLPTADGGPALGKRDAKLETVALIWGGMPAGVAVSREGRIFLSFPKWTPQVQYSLGELTKDRGLVAFPDERSHRRGDADGFDSVQGIFIDDGDRLWLLDAGAGKLSVVDLSTNRVTKTVPVPQNVMKPAAYFNDLRVDPRRGVEGTAYISDSLGGGIIVLDVATGEAWRRLKDHPSARAADDVVAEVEGVKLPTFRGNTDGIALSPDGKTLYYCAFTRRDVYSVPTDALVDRGTSEEQVAAAVKLIATKPSACDGIGCDAQGRVYTTDHEDNAIRRITPTTDGADARVEVIVQDERLLWPDAVWLHGGYVYITTNQLNRLPHLHGGKDLRQPPYALFRYPIDRAK